jgi:tetraacyldisaccharide 4'-kinase
VNVLTFLLLPFSWLFGVGVALRNKCFDWGIFRTESLGVPTISVGNLTVGGTGKTPLVASIARYLQQKGKRVAILSRGYKRKSTGFVLVSDEEKVLVGATVGGDEPQELAQQLQGVVVAVDEKRARAGKKVLERFSIDAFILDDGFQHRAVKRDVDIVTIPASSGQPPSYSRTPSEFLIPAGRRREPLRCLKRANLLVFTRARDLGSSIDAFEEMRKRFRRVTAAIASAVDFQVRALVCLSDRKEEDLKRFVGKKASLFCGTADPGSFFRLAADSGLEVVRTKSFPDHYRYQAQDLLSLGNQFPASGAELLLTTMKDAARLSDFPEGEAFLRDFPVYGLAVEIEFLHGEKDFYRQLDGLFA